MADVEDPEKSNSDFPFDPKEVKALFLTHGHTDHIGRLPLLCKKGFTGKIYCTDATRDLSEVMLRLSAELGGSGSEKPLYGERDVESVLKQMEPVVYNKKKKVDELTIRFTDAGHILGSAMIDVWVDGRKILFSGDMGPDTTPMLCSPTQHFSADAVLVESTYGPTPRDEVSYEDFGKSIEVVLKRGGSVLIPSFAIHKTQCLLYIIHKLVEDGIIPKEFPIYSDSSTARQCTRIYEDYVDYFDEEARKRADKKQSLFYRGRYREGRPADTLQTHRAGPAIYISTSGMLTNAASPKHLFEMSRDPKNAVFIVGYQSPNSPGAKLLAGDEKVEIEWQEQKEGKSTSEKRMADIKLEVKKMSGFSSHARGQQILEWIHDFEEIGPVYVVHGDKKQSFGMSDRIKEMKVNSEAPQAGQTFVVKEERSKPGPIPKLEAQKQALPAVVDQ